MSIQIMLNPDLVLTPARVLNQDQLSEAMQRSMSSLSRIAYPPADYNAPRAELVRALQEDSKVFQRGFMDIAGYAYTSHHGLEVSPEQLWFIVLTQIAEAIANRPDDFRSLFTTSDEKQEILIEQDHPTDINMLALVEKLKTYVPGDVSVFLPELSTHTVESRTAHAAAFADALQQYYDYGMFCCGIKEIQLTGTAEDWELLLNNTTKILELFIGQPNMSAAVCSYLERVQNVFANITETFTRCDQNNQFWLDIFSQKNVGSGGDRIVSGWLTDLYLKGKRGNLVKSFHNTIAQVPYKNVTTREEFVMLTSAFRVNHLGGAILQPQFDHVTFRKPA